MRKNFTYIDLFAGCGGLSLGLHHSGWTGLFAVEKSADAFATLKYNLIDEKHHFEWPEWLPQTNHDINLILESYSDNLKSLRGTVDLVVGGPPCQGFSTAGLRKEDDVRNELIRSYLKFISLVRPKFILFENVRGFTLEFKKNKSKGLAYSQYVVRVLQFLGYEVTGKMLDFSKYGLPQKRTRFILAGIRKDVAKDKHCNSKMFFKILRKNRSEFLKHKALPMSTTLSGAISDLLKFNGVVTCRDRKNFFSGVYSSPKSKYQIYLRKGLTDDIPDSHSFPKHSKEIVKRFKYIIKHQAPNKNLENKIRVKLNINKHTVILLDGNGKTPTITTLPDDYIHYCEPRILTVREYARVQSFPDWYKIKGKYTTGGKVRTKEVPRYTQLGNAIPPLFGEQCGVSLKCMISNEF